MHDMNGIYEFDVISNEYSFNHSDFQNRKVKRCGDKILNEPFYRELINQIISLDKENRRLMEVNTKLHLDLMEVNDILDSYENE